MDFLEKNIEALIFCTSEPIGVDDIQNCLTDVLGIDVPTIDIDNALQNLIQKYANEQYSFHIAQAAQGYYFLTKLEYQRTIASWLKTHSNKKLSKTALETLAIVAYKQPVTKGQIEQIRGVNSDYTIQRLLEKELIRIKGKAKTPGNPILYSTTHKFMEYFGINSLKDLPLPRDFALEQLDEAFEEVPLFHKANTKKPKVNPEVQLFNYKKSDDVADNQQKPE